MLLNIIKIGLDVHSTSYTAAVLKSQWGGDASMLSIQKLPADVEFLKSFINDIKEKAGGECDIECGYEAGCLGTSLYRELMKSGIKTTILAPTTMLEPKSGKRIKTDARDAVLIAKCLASGGYSPVYVTSEEDEAVKSYIRMRSDIKEDITHRKQQIDGFMMRLGFQYHQKKWSEDHRSWLRKTGDSMHPIYKMTLEQYMIVLEQTEAQLAIIERKIEEMADSEIYKDRVSKLICMLGIKKLTALSIITEIGDFTRFEKATSFASFLGLVPGENSSGDSLKKTGLTKAGNQHLRKMLIESSEGICKGHIGYKGADLKRRQKGSSPEVIAYADYGNTRLRKKYYAMLKNKKKRNVAVAAVARELACFVWGMMTNHMELRH